MSFETDRWPIIRAKWFTKSAAKRAVRLVVIHDMEAPEGALTAENVARWFQTEASEPASAHICVDNDSIVQCVLDNDVAHAAPGCNNDGIQIEIAGYARQTMREWLDDYSVQALNRAAHATAQYCLKYGIPVRQLSNAQLKAGEKGIIGHRQASQVYRKSDHMDPGDNFPWEYFIAAVKAYHTVRKMA